jgi:hypothetical protein
MFAKTVARSNTNRPLGRLDARSRLDRNGGRIRCSARAGGTAPGDQESVAVIQDYEKLGAFYLGKLYDPEHDRLQDDLLLYDAKDLTTHGLCVGMTGSGKTGLCLSLIEEAAIDGIPVLAIDPKGDLGNLMLTFPALRPEDFLPWVDPHAATRKGVGVEAYARDTAHAWRSGLAEWGQEPERIQRFKDAAEVAIYTPGSSAGLPLSLLGSFAAPPPNVLADADALHDRMDASVAGLLALLGIDADPMRSREYLLLSTILSQGWHAGRHFDLPGLIRDIQKPPFDMVGVFDLESFYPAADRMALAMALNHLLASPGFSVWLEGDPLDLPRLLYTPNGKPRISILSIAHLSETERMFVVTIVLNELLTWTRAQTGSASLRALFYMDEIFGYFPPTANPPSKRPLLTLLKQARAYGVGVMLATQNPVDLDYKGLSNTGTWFLGRLQTERDKQRVLDGLEGAASGAGGRFNRARMDSLLSGLGSRRFLMHNVHEDQPVVFQSRWALSYLRGPMSRSEVEALMGPTKTKATTDDRAKEHRSPSSPPLHPPLGGLSRLQAERPVVPAAIEQYFGLCTRIPDQAAELVYRPRLTAEARLHYVRAGAGVDIWEEVSLTTALPTAAGSADWDAAPLTAGRLDHLGREPEPNARFAALPASALHADHYAAWGKALADHLYRHRTRTLFRCDELKLYSGLGESEGAFRGRIAHAVHERRDQGIERLRQSYGRKLATLQDRLRRAQDRLERERAQYDRAKMDTAISVGATVLGALFGRKLASHRNVGRAATAMRGVGRASKEQLDIDAAREEIEAQSRKLREMETEFERAVEELQQDLDPNTVELTPIPLRPRKSDIAIERIGLLWTPWGVSSDGAERPLAEQS